MQDIRTQEYGHLRIVIRCRECSHLLELLLQIGVLPCFPGFHPQLVGLLLQALRAPLQRGLLLLCCRQEALLLLICSPESLELLRQARVSIWIMPAGSPAWQSEVRHSSCMDQPLIMEGMHTSDSAMKWRHQASL